MLARYKASELRRRSGLRLDRARMFRPKIGLQGKKESRYRELHVTK